MSAASLGVRPRLRQGTQQRTHEDEELQGMGGGGSGLDRGPVRRSTRLPCSGSQRAGGWVMPSPGFIDCCVYSDWASQDEGAGYLPLAWQDYLIRPGRIGGPPRGRPIDLRSPCEAPFGPFGGGLGGHGGATNTQYRA